MKLTLEGIKDCELWNKADMMWKRFHKKQKKNQSGYILE